MRSFVSGRGASEDRRSVISGNSSNASTLVQESIISNKTTTSQLRKFTAGVGRPGLAREAREAVRNVITTQNPTRKSPIGEPLDYEKFITEKAIQLENDSQRELLLFPRDDIEESKVYPDSSTVLPTVSEDDLSSAKWLLTKEALRLYISPHRIITFNYSKFAGDYNRVNEGSSAETDVALSSLVFESDMALEEEKAAMEGFLLSDIVKEGYIMVVKSDPSLLDNLKSAKKRYCILRRLEGGDIAIEIRKTPSDAPKRAPLKINSAQLKCTKKGKTVLEIEPYAENEKNDRKPLMIASEDSEELSNWLLNVQRAIAIANKGDSISVCSERFEKSDRSLSEPAADSESINSEDSGRDVAVWRGRNSAARVLQPPIVDRKNIFSLFYQLNPLPDAKGEPSSILSRSRGSLPQLSSSPVISSFPLTPSRKRSCNGQAVRFLVEFRKLDIKLPVGNGSFKQIEAFFVHMFVFDAYAGRRISEEFCMEVEESDDMKTIKKDCVVLDSKRESNGISEFLLTNRSANKVICTVVTPHKDLWIVCRIDRMLSGDTSGDLYMKSTGDAKSTLKLQKTIQSSYIRLANYRQRFAWGARPVFTDLKSGDLTGGSSKESGTIQLFRCEGNKFTEADLQKNLNDFSKVEKAGKITIPNASISLRVDLSVKLSDFPFRVNPSLFPLRPWISPRDSPVPPVFELQSFGDIVTEPYSELVNLLYVYPLGLKYDNQKIFSKARNISCKVRFVRGEEQLPTKAVIDRQCPSGLYSTFASCAIQHHQQCPSFGDEIKMRLPLTLTISDHILFSFSHVSVAGQNNTKSPEMGETPIGYSWLPLVWKKDRLIMESDEQEFTLPVAVDLPHKYFRSKPLGLGKGEEAAEIRWVDQRPLFRVRLRLVSSAFTTDSKLQSFFQACQRLENKGITGDATDLVKPKSKSMSPSASGDPVRSCSPLARTASLDEEHPLIKDLILRTDALSEVNVNRLIPFLPVILSRLFSLLPCAPTEELALSTLSTIVSICDRCSAVGKKSLLRAFVRLHFLSKDNGEENTHGLLCKYLSILLLSVQNNLDDLAATYRQLWVLFDVVCKSMAQSIVHKALYKTSRRDRFSPEIIEQIGNLIETLVQQFISKHRELADECRLANTAVAFLLRCCLSFTDRGAVFKWIYCVVQRLDDNDSRILREYKTDLLTIITQHEHWLPLCLPVLIDSRNQIQRVNYQSTLTEPASSTSNGPGFITRFFNQIFQAPILSELTESDRYSFCSDEWWLSSLYASRHFLVGLLLQELSACLREPRDYRRRPIALLRNVLAKHSYDKRYLDMNIQRRIAILYAPLIRFALDHVSELEAATTETPEVIPTGLRAKYKWRSLDRRSNVLNEISSRPLLQVSGSSQFNTTPTIAPLAEKLDGDEIKDILVSVLFVVHRLPKRILGSLWNEAEGARAGVLLRLFEIALDVFRYRDKEYAMAATCKQVRGSFRAMHLIPSSSSRLPSVDLNRSGIPTQLRMEDDTITSSPLPFRVLQLLNLSQEVALIVLDSLQTFAQQLASRRSKVLLCTEELFYRLLSLHLLLLEEHWSEAVRLHAIAALALFVNLFRVRLFESGPLDALSILIERILLQMASRLTTVQTAVAALLQLVLRNGYETTQSYLASQAMAISVAPSAPTKPLRVITSAERLGRPGAQTGVALARLLGIKSAISSSSRFEKGLAALENLVIANETRKITSFDRAVLDLLRQLRGVMFATVALKDAANDPIRLADLHIQLADSYRGSAALRSAWFDTLAEAYAADRWYAEAAVCHAHSVAIIAKELRERGELELNWDVFDWISRSIILDENTNETESNVQPAGFTVENLATKIEKTAHALTLAERYEAIGPLYRLLIPLFEKNNNFNSLVSLYAELQQTYSRAAEVKISGKRHLSTYFRVRFFGKAHFEIDHDTEWIYREAGLTSLAEISLRLKEYCRQIVGHERVQVEPENEVGSLLDSSIAYVYVTHIEPLTIEGRNAKHFLSHTNVREFVYESPIIEGEKSEQEPLITQQALKRTVLQVEGSFPSTRRRLRVSSHSEQIFSPLEFACQKLQTKATQIRNTLSVVSEGQQLDVKGLQLLLQGAVMPTVNVGPLAYAEAFTQPDQRERYGERGMEDLKTAFCGLMSACELALQANESAVGADQQTYHDVLLASFDAMHERLFAFFGVSLRANLDDERKVELPKSAIHILDSISGVNA